MVYFRCQNANWGSKDFYFAIKVGKNISSSTVGIRALWEKWFGNKKILCLLTQTFPLPEIYPVVTLVRASRWPRWESICLQCQRPGFNPWRREWQPTPGKSHGWRNLVGYRPWGRKELDTTSLSLLFNTCKTTRQYVDQEPSVQHC